MNDKCYEIGTIQAFTDGELESGLAEGLLKHVSGCAACAELLSTCEDESSLTYSLLDEELNVLVPTERLRAKVFGSIDEMEDRRSFGWLSGLASGFAGAFSFRSPGLAVAGSVLLIVGILAIGVNIFQQPQNVAEVTDHGASGNDVVSIDPGALDTSEVQAPVDAQETVADQVEDLNDRPAQRPGRFRATRAVYVPDANDGNDVRPMQANMPAMNSTVTSEGSYLQTIATLDKTVESGKQMLTPSERIAFERDLAVVNDAIVKMKEQVKKNPDNVAAREVLKSSYQNKVDLLNSVAEKTDLMASLQ